MTSLLVLFLDGVGLGEDDPQRNPLAAASMPSLESLLEGGKILASTCPYEGELATLLSLDATLGVEGAPQSATGQAALLTGRNVPAELGRHYGPKPNPEVAEILTQWNLFHEVMEAGGSAALLNAYPPQYFQAIERGRRLYSAIPLAAKAAGVPLMTAEDLQHGRALSADFTGVGWNARPEFPSAPTYTPEQAGALLARLAQRHDLTWFDYWLSDYAGHRGTFQEAVGLMERFDRVLGALIHNWEPQRGLVVIVSDHGNMEDIQARGHTRNPVPAFVIGSSALRALFTKGLHDLTDLFPAVRRAWMAGERL